MTCNCNCPYKHTTTALTAAGVLTVTNPNNVGNFDKFCLVLTINPNSVITGDPVNYTITINGTAVPIWDRWGYPITTDRLCTRKCYIGRFIESATPHLTLVNACSNTALTGIATASTSADSTGS